ncbi:putative phosphoketolase [Leucoagaricus sp. SymC.cos]|nr:putative phosphoketolase [Leucoagaricus sp. SymC.cos]
MIFLRNNILLKRDLTFDDIKPHLLEPGHGAPGVLACLWLEDSLSTFWPKYSRNYEGLFNLITTFSIPGGFPSHINAQTPGAIHEVGELGYALSVAFGAAMDNPDLICIDPVKTGAVLPILHINGFKVSERTTYGAMDDRELVSFFVGYGYQPCMVEDMENIDRDLATLLSWAISEIHKIQHAMCSDNPIIKPRWPVILLCTPGNIIEGSFQSHQVPLPKAKSDERHLRPLDAWLKSYNPQGLFQEDALPVEAVRKLIPSLGRKRESYKAYIPLDVPDWRLLTIRKVTQERCMKCVGKFLGEAIALNSKTLRIFSPDGLVSNKLDVILECTSCNFQWDMSGGHVIEILSKYTCQGMLQGYTHCIAGASVRKFASIDDDINPDVVLVSRGVEVTFEVIAAASLLCKRCLNLHVWAVNIIDLIVLNHKCAHPHALDDEQFNMLFTEDRPVHFNYHGYPIELQGLLFGRPGLMEHVTIAGYKGEGTTTLPFDMMLCNNMSRFDFVIAAIHGGSRVNPKVAVNVHIEISALRHKAKKVQDYIYKHGEDPEGTYTIILLKHILHYEGLFSISLGVWLLSF